MARHPLEALARELDSDRRRFAEVHVHPVLLWSPPLSAADSIGQTLAPSATPRARRGRAVAIEVVKATGNAFAFGVTVGNADGNDLVLKNERVSRFHAFFQRGPAGASLVDAESTNGTFLDGVRLLPNRPAALLPAARISFGGETVTYLEPARLVANLEEMLRRPTLE